MEPNIEADHSQLDSVRWSLIQRRRAKQGGRPSMKPLGQSLKGYLCGQWFRVEMRSQTFSTV